MYSVLCESLHVTTTSRRTARASGNVRYLAIHRWSQGPRPGTKRIYLHPLGLSFAPRTSSAEHDVRDVAKLQWTLVCETYVQSSQPTYTRITHHNTRPNTLAGTLEAAMASSMGCQFWRATLLLLAGVAASANTSRANAAAVCKVCRTDHILSCCTQEIHGGSSRRSRGTRNRAHAPKACSRCHILLPQPRLSPVTPASSHLRLAMPRCSQSTLRSAARAVWAPLLSAAHQHSKQPHLASHHNNKCLRLRAARCAMLRSLATAQPVSA